jgi:hypothetical protein
VGRVRKPCPTAENLIDAIGLSPDWLEAKIKRRATSPPSAALWNRNDDFADLLARFHVAMRIRDVLQMKGSINNRDKFAGPYPVNKQAELLKMRHSPYEQ